MLTRYHTTFQPVLRLRHEYEPACIHQQQRPAEQHMTSNTILRFLENDKPIKKVLYFLKRTFFFFAFFARADDTGSTIECATVSFLPGHWSGFLSSRNVARSAHEESYAPRTKGQTSWLTQSSNAMASSCTAFVDFVSSFSSKFLGVTWLLEARGSSIVARNCRSGEPRCLPLLVSLANETVQLLRRIACCCVSTVPTVRWNVCFVAEIPVEPNPSN